MRGTGKKILGFVLSLLVGAVIGILLVLMNLDSPLLDPDNITSFMVGWVLLVAIMVLAVLVQIPLHELGHMVCGLLSGYRFVSFRIGPLMWTRTTDGIKLTKLSIPGTGGQCLMNPPDLKENGSYPYKLYNLGGGLANLLVAVVAFLVWLLVPSTVAAMVSSCFVLSGIALAATNLIPMQAGGVPNDCKNLLAMRSSSLARDALWLMLRINAQMAQGKRMRDFDIDLFELPQDADMSNQMIVSIAQMQVGVLVDSGRIDEAGQLAREILESPKIAGLIRQTIVCEALFAELMGPARSEVIEEYNTREFQAFLKGMAGQASILRLRYALALLHDDDPAAAASIRTQFDNLARSYPYPAELEGEREHLARIDTKLEQQTAAA
jgi:hypothetical protein